MYKSSCGHRHEVPHSLFAYQTHSSKNTSRPHCSYHYRDRKTGFSSISWIYWISSSATPFQSTPDTLPRLRLGRLLLRLITLRRCPHGLRPALRAKILCSSLCFLWLCLLPLRYTPNHYQSRHSKKYWRRSPIPRQACSFPTISHRTSPFSGGVKKLLTALEFFVHFSQITLVRVSAKYR